MKTTRESRRERPPARRRGGFTFIEILVVMVILALIAGIVGTQLLGQAEKAKADSTRIQIRSLASALDLYRLHNSTYPSTEQGLSALLLQPNVGSIPRAWQGPYITGNNLPTDGWGNDFLYSSAESSHIITSLGADGVQGGIDLDADIANTDL